MHDYDIDAFGMVETPEPAQPLMPIELSLTKKDPALPLRTPRRSTGR